jgi:alpha-L-fucosidase 2
MTPSADPPRSRRLALGSVAAALALAGAVACPRGRAVQAAPSDLRLAAPIERWDEALPLGNGLLGGLVWGAGNTLNVSLDRGDLWDLRVPEVLRSEEWTFATVRRLVAEGDHERRVELFDDPYDMIPYPTKLPGGRLVVVLDSDMVAREFTLRLSTAEAQVSYGDREATGFFSAVEPVALFRLPSPTAHVALTRPTSLDVLGYPPADTGRGAGTVWMEQRAALGLRYAIVAGTRPDGDGMVLAVTIASTADGDDPLDIARARVASALERGYAAMAEPHRAWWRRFWDVSEVHLPDSAIQAQYDLAKYFYGAASRRGAPPIPLQGVWTADGGTLPPWKGDFHNDLNTQTTYLACDAAGLDEACESWLDFNWKLLPAYRRFAREFFGVGGAAVPGVMALDGQPLGGWGQYSLSPTMGAWVAQAYHLHWRYTGDHAFLVERAYPFLSEIGEATLALLEPDSAGMLKLPLSTSPEIRDNSPAAWLPPNSNFDLALLRWLFAALVETAEAAGDPEGAQRWGEALRRLDPLDRDAATGALTFARGLPYAESHRHFSHAMALHPLALLDPEGADAATVHSTLDGLAEYGSDWWVGYSFSWYSAMLARAGRAEEALRQLEIFVRAFLLRNGFHANGDQIGGGYSRFTYRPFTLEGNFLAMHAVQEMLLQSWGGTVRVFPAVSARWADASFRDLRAEGGFRVSATRRGGCTARVGITATRDAELRLRDPFAGREARWNRPDVDRAGRDLRVRMRSGEALSGSAGC